MTAVEAMREVYGFLNDSNVAGAQAAVVAIENEGSVLPSSVFERVLEQAVEAGKLASFYANFCKRAYGEGVYNGIVDSAKAVA
jgi:hypothetical protein